MSGFGSRFDSASASRDGYARLQSWGIFVLGCSVDSADAHRAFIRKVPAAVPVAARPRQEDLPSAPMTYVMR
jgi:peroxiredoxin